MNRSDLLANAPALRSHLVQLIPQQTPGTVCHFVCSAEDYSQPPKIILHFKLFKKSSPRTYQGTRGKGQGHQTKDSKHHVIFRKNEILPLLNHVSTAFQIYIKSTSLSEKTDIKTWTQVQQNASYLHVESLDHLGVGLSALRARVQIS